MSTETARERTRLAWRRTVLTGTVVGLLFLRLAGPGAVVAVPAWLVLLLVAHRRIGALGHARTQSTGRTLALVVAVVTTLAVFGTALLVLP